SPDSTSSKAVTRDGTVAFDDPRRSETAAASVGAVTAPIRSASGQEIPKISTANAPTTPALIKTPAVASATDGQSTNRIALRSVLSPPWNKIAVSARLPTR